MKSEKEPSIAVGVIVYRLSPSNSVEYLLLRKAKNIWEPPKGRINPGEDHFQAAVRETKEESDLSVDQLQFDSKFGTIFLDYLSSKNQHKSAEFWLAKTGLNSQVTLSHEHEEFKWCKIDEVERYIRFDMGKGFRKVDNYLLQSSSGREVDVPSSNT